MEELKIGEHEPLEIYLNRMNINPEIVKNIVEYVEKKEDLYYQNGYDTGFEDGQEIGFDNGHDEGYDEGYSEAYNEGYYEGCTDTSEKYDNKND